MSFTGYCPTPEARRAAIQKGIATKRRNIAEREAAKNEAKLQRGRLLEQIRELESRLAGLRSMEAVATAAAKACGKSLLREEQILRAALPWGKACGVYFLIDSGRIVYVGQSKSVFNRIGQHVDKVFDSYAYVPCGPDALDRVESLYIHVLRPALNKTNPDGSKVAPIAFDALMNAR